MALSWAHLHRDVSVFANQQLCTDTGSNLEDLLVGTNGERASGKSVQTARHDEDDNIFIIFFHEVNIL